MEKAASSQSMISFSSSKTEEHSPRWAPSSKPKGFIKISLQNLSIATFMLAFLASKKSVSLTLQTTCRKEGTSGCLAFWLETGLDDTSVSATCWSLVVPTFGLRPLGSTFKDELLEKSWLMGPDSHGCIIAGRTPTSAVALVRESEKSNPERGMDLSTSTPTVGRQSISSLLEVSSKTGCSLCPDSSP